MPQLDTPISAPPKVRCRSGCDGLDDILGGGFPRGHFCLLEGEPGTGKTTLALTLSESPQDLQYVANSHGIPCRGLLFDAAQLIDRAIKETRTLSHLLHPPSHDAAGFASAARWYIESFGNRSGIQTSLQLPDGLGRLPTSVETALLRIMQEALINLHRHSKSPKVEIDMQTDGAIATLIIRDFGKGIPRETLEQFKESGTNVGVGLAGIWERMKELGGTFEIHSNNKGTSLKATLPSWKKCRTSFPRRLFRKSIRRLPLDGKCAGHEEQTRGESLNRMTMRHQSCIGSL